MLTPKSSRHRYVNMATGEQVADDPRLGALPPEWERVVHERTADDPAYFQFFRHSDTGEVINFDPRLSPECLQARGVQLETFDLI